MKNRKSVGIFSEAKAVAVRFRVLLGGSLLVSAIFGCGGGAGLSGRTSYAGVPVCLDENENLVCEPGERFVLADSEGNFRLPGSSPRESLLVASVQPESVCRLDGRSAGVGFPLVRRGSGNGDLNVWSTLAWVRGETGGTVTDQEAWESVWGAFALPAGTGTAAGKNPPGSDDPTRTIEQAALKLYEQEFNLGGDLTGEIRARVQAAAEETLAHSALLLDLVDQYAQTGQEPPSNAGGAGGEALLPGYSRIPLNINMGYGIGLDESDYSLKGNCLEQDFVPVPGLCENTGQYVFELIESIHDVAKHLEVGAAAKAGVSVAGFDVVSVSGGYRFLKDTTLRDDHLYIAVKHGITLCGYPVSAKLTPQRESEFGTDYEAFREACGDRYLQSLITGGYFYGLIEVTLRLDQDIKTERLNLSGKVLGIKVFDKTWTSTVVEIAENYANVSTRVTSNFFQYSPNTLSVSETIGVYDEFIDRIQSDYCQGATANVNCSYLASFAPYATATSLATPAAENQVLTTYLPNMRSWEAYYFKVEDIIASLKDIVTQPLNYNIGQDVDTFSKPNTWTVDSLIDLLEKLTDRSEFALNQWSACSADIYRCTENSSGTAFLDEPHILTWLDMKQALPRKKFTFPDSCKELADQRNVIADGEYDLYLGGRFGERFHVYCGYQGTSQPRTFLVLRNTSANPDLPSYNHVWIATGPGTGQGKIFTRLEVENPDAVTTAAFLNVSERQEDFYQTSTLESTMLERLKLAPVLSARASALGSARANLNLEGTDFHLGPDPVFGLRGNLKGFRFQVEISTDRKNVDLLLEPVPGGAPAVTEAVVLPVSPIRLEHD